MMLRRVAIGIGVALALGAMGWWLVVEFVPAATYDMDVVQLQSRIEQRFPQKNCAMLVACLTVSDPHVVLADGSERIGLVADLLLTVGRREMPGKAAFSGVLRYVRYDGDFYLDDLRVDQFELAGLSPAMQRAVQEYGPALLRRALEGHPVYSLKGDTAGVLLARLAVRDVRIVAGKVRVTFLRLGA